MMFPFSFMSLVNKPITVVAPVAPVVDSNFGNIVIIGPGTNGVGRYNYVGNTWTFGSAPFSVGTNTKICYGNGLWVIVGNDAGTMKSASSPNGTTWTTSNSVNSIIPGTNSAYISGLAFGNGIFMTCGYNSGLSATGTPVAISSNGLTWVNGGNIFGANTLTNSVGYGNGYWVAVANNGGDKTNNLRYSTNVSVAGNTSISWAGFVGLDADPLYSVLYNNNRWFIGGLGGKIFYSATNLPTSFTMKPNPSSTAFPMALSSVPGTLAIGMWVPAGGGTNRIFQIDSSGTTFIAVGGGESIYTLNTADLLNNTITFSATPFTTSIKAVISTNSGVSWSSISSVNTNMTGCYGVAFAK
jgi:hypothetical protein